MSALGFEHLIFFLLAALAVFVTRRGAQAGDATFLASSFVIVAGAALALAVWTPSEPTFPEAFTPERVDDQGYVSSETCRSCHPSQYASWYRSYHRTMTQVASPETIAAPHESVKLEGGSRTFEVLFDEEGSMFAGDVDQWRAYRHLKKHGPELPPDFPRKTGEVVMTTGSHHMQLYWIPGDRGELTQLSWTWLIRDQRWVPGEMVYLQPPDGTAGLAATWGGNCISCHATGGQPRRDAEDAPRGLVDPHVGELGIACEACHGPAGEHVAINQEVTRRYRLHLDDEPDPTIVNPERLAPEVASETCAFCHSGHTRQTWNKNTGDRFRPGDRIDDYVAMRRFDELPEDQRPSYFWSDGTSRVTGREYTAMVQSDCHLNGDIGCLSCHSMHESDPNDQLARGMEGDGACLQCHPGVGANLTAHTHHAADSPGSRCNNCHMPNTTYGLLMMTRSHRIDSPSAAKSATTDRPNACNLCHLDQSIEWADERIARWYGGSRGEFTEEQRDTPAGALWLLKGDATQRAAAAWHMGWGPAIEATGRDFQPPLLARAIADPYAAVRYLADRSLREFAGFGDLDFDFVEPPGRQQRQVAAAIARSARTFSAKGHLVGAAEMARLIAERNNVDRTIFE